LAAILVLLVEGIQAAGGYGSGGDRGGASIKMKYYLYVSDAKVEMLLPQIPYAEKEKVSGEFGFDIKIISAKVKSEVTTLEDRIARLITVTKYMAAHEPVGTVDNPQTWVKGTHVVEYGYLGDDTKAVGFSGSVATRSS
jgi:hypothetical protein